MPNTYESKDDARLITHCAALRRAGGRLLFTNGCFDLLHAGHVVFFTWLNEQRQHPADTLLVGVNSDASVRRLKGPTRPLNTLADRLSVLQALRFIDLVVPFDEDTPEELIRVVRPEVVAKGGDYAGQRLAGQAFLESYGAQILKGPYTGLSTTKLLQRSQESNCTLGSEWVEEAGPVSGSVGLFGAASHEAETEE